MKTDPTDYGPYDDAMIDRCCLYLLGEMPAAEADDFARECAKSVELQACLEAQAELIARLGTALADSRSTGKEPQPTTLPQRQSQPAAAEGGGPSQWLARRGAIAAALALAASLLVWVGLQRNAELEGEDVPETLQLAHAWAAGRGELATAEEWASDALSGDASTGDAWRSEPWSDRELLAEGAGVAADLPGEELEVISVDLGPPQWLIVAVRALEAESAPTASDAFNPERSAGGMEERDE